MVLLCTDETYNYGRLIFLHQDLLEENLLMAHVMLFFYFVTAAYISVDLEEKCTVLLFICIYFPTVRSSLQWC